EAEPAGRPRAMLVISDGEQNHPTGMGPRAAAELARALAIPISTIDVGGDPTATPALERLARTAGRESLQEVARITGGTFATADDPAAFRTALAAWNATTPQPLATAETEPFVPLARPIALAALLLWGAIFLLEKGLGRSARPGPRQSGQWTLPRFTWLRRSMAMLAFSLLLGSILVPGTLATTSSAEPLRGRSVVILLDVSRSMLAADMATVPATARWQAGQRAAATFLQRLHRRGNHRAAVVLVGAAPYRLVPLTPDLPHAMAALVNLDARLFPAVLRATDDRRSGTRLGAGIVAALAQLPPSDLAAEILLFTDGDDPDATAREWEAGITAARQARIPVHVVALGHATQPAMMIVDGQPLEAAREGGGGVRSPILTQLRPEVARSIATGTGGTLLQSEDRLPDLGRLAEKFLLAPQSPWPTSHRSPVDTTPWTARLAVGLLMLAWGVQRGQSRAGA
ncbi:MAG: vWA domain-containing protein, partial [Gemmataceae bacterium]